MSLAYEPAALQDVRRRSNLGWAPAWCGCLCDGGFGCALQGCWSGCVKHGSQRPVSENNARFRLEGQRKCARMAEPNWLLGRRVVVGEPVHGRLGGQKKQFDGCSAYQQIRLAPLSLSLTSYLSVLVTPSSLHRDSNAYLIVCPLPCPALLCALLANQRRAAIPPARLGQPKPSAVTRLPTACLGSRSCRHYVNRMHARSGAMPDPQRSDHGDHGALTTATIFDDAVYCAEALRLPSNQTEDQVDAELALSATESGIPDPYQLLCVPHDVSRALSTVTLDSDHRSSMSIHSQETQSTSFTSAPSRTSRDHTHNNERLPAMRSPPKLARTSPTAECQDPLSGPSVSCIHQSSHSNLSVSQAVLSDFLFSAPVPRKKRTSGLFSMFRKNSRYRFSF
jgi:hypothetical protein